MSAMLRELKSDYHRLHGQRRPNCLAFEVVNGDPASHPEVCVFLSIRSLAIPTVECMQAEIPQAYRTRTFVAAGTGANAERI